MSQLGIVTYNIAIDWDLPTILARLEKLDDAGVELHTGHANQVDVSLTRDWRTLRIPWPLSISVAGARGRP
ncbi:MAG: hypothetical protein ACLP7Q_26920 [Isosphaeraceae bacterium]